MLKKVLGCMIVVTLISGTLLAQTRRIIPERTRVAQRQTEAVTTEQTAPHMQQHYASCVLLGNQKEVVMAKFAYDKVQNPEVKQFAQMLEKDHTQMVAQLQKLVPGAIDTERLTERSDALRTMHRTGKVVVPEGITEKTEMTPANEPQGQKVAEPQGQKSVETQYPSRFYTNLKQQYVEYNIALTQNELLKLEKNEFDKAYIGQQIYAHTAMLAELKTIKPYATGELKKIVESEEIDIQAHLDQAVKIWKNLESKGVTTVSKVTY